MEYRVEHRLIRIQEELHIDIRHRWVAKEEILASYIVGQRNLHVWVIMIGHERKLIRFVVRAAIYGCKLARWITCRSIVLVLSIWFWQTDGEWFFSYHSHAIEAVSATWLQWLRE